MANTYPTFLKMKLRALTLPRNEIERHASVSTNNHHKCRECFTCACVEALQSLREADEISQDDLEAASDFYDRL